jgi:hypothetical protein
MASLNENRKTDPAISPIPRGMFCARKTLLGCRAFSFIVLVRYCWER